MIFPRGIERRVGLRDDVLVFAVGRQVADLVRDDAVVHDAVGRLDEAVLVDAREGRERADQTDVRAFRRLDRADAAVVRVVDVADFEAGALAREAARPEGRETALVRELGQRVRLVHELRELARAEELFDRRYDRTDVDERLRRDGLDVLNGHALAHDALEAQQTDPELVLQQLADRADAAVSEVVDVVDVDLLGRDFDQAANDRDHVLAHEALLVDRRDRQAGGDVLALELARELVAADAGEIVALLVEEERLDQLLGVLGVLGLARAQLLVDLFERVLARLDVLVLLEAVDDQRAVVE